MCKFVQFETLSGKENMEKDLFLFNEASKLNIKEPVLRFYGWSPACVSLGRNQTEEKINIEYCKKNKYHFVSAIDCEVGIDGEHLTISGHKKLGDIVNSYINKING